MSVQYWLLKTEPSTYSFQRLQKEGKTNWNGVRNFQARNHLRTIKKGDIAVIYHSGEERSAVGLARVVKEAYADPDPKKPGDWVQVDLEPIQPLPAPVALSTIKSTAALKDIPLIRLSRLSVMPITYRHFESLVKLSESPSPAASTAPKAAKKTSAKRRAK